MKQIIITLMAIFAAGTLGNATAQSPGYFGYPGYQDFKPPSAMGYRNQGRIRIERDRNEEGYQLRIHTSGDIAPEAIQVSVQGNSILIVNDQSYQTEERGDQGYYSFSRSSSTMRRRLSIPRDADVENMQRRVEEGVIIITLPYLKEYRL